MSFCLLNHLSYNLTRYMQHFDIVAIEKTVDWLNVMTYDLHGTWDSTDRFIGPIVNAHTNLTEIDNTMDLFWRNKVRRSRKKPWEAVVLRQTQLTSAPGGCLDRSGQDRNGPRILRSKLHTLRPIVQLSRLRVQRRWKSWEMLCQFRGQSVPSFLIRC